MPRNRGVDDTDPLPLMPESSPRSWKGSSSPHQRSRGVDHPPLKPESSPRSWKDTSSPPQEISSVARNRREDQNIVLHPPPLMPDDVSVERYRSGELGRCPSLNLEWLLQLQDKKKGIAAHDRGSSFRPDNLIPARRSVREQEQIVDNLLAQGFTGGLARTLIQHSDQFPIRIWLVDNSGSMNASDGHLAVVQKPSSKSSSTTTTPPRIENVNCTRWEEVTSCVMWHANLSAMLGGPMAVRLINDPGVNIGPQQLSVAASDQQDVQQEVKRLKHLLGHSPGGCNPLTVHLKDIIDSLVGLGPKLRQRCELVAIVIVTDGLPTDSEGREGNYVNEEFINALQQLRGLPVWVVIRLSTDEKRVVDFYNALDRKMSVLIDDTNYDNIGREEIVAISATGGGSSGTSSSGGTMNLDVLDDFFCEANEVYGHNPWLNYALPLHLCRESGVTFPSFDALDNRLLTPRELADFVAILFDRHYEASMLVSDGAAQTRWTTGNPLPNPSTHYQDFREEVVEMLRDEENLFNPIKNKMLPWINLKELDRIYGAGTKEIDTPCACNIL